MALFCRLKPFAGIGIPQFNFLKTLFLIINDAIDTVWGHIFAVNNIRSLVVTRPLAMSMFKNSVSPVAKSAVNVRSPSVKSNVSTSKYEQSMSSLHTAFEHGDTKLLKEVNEKPTQDWRFLVALIVPIFAVLCLGTISLSDSVSRFSTSTMLADGTEHNQKMNGLVQNLQKERGMSCTFLSTEANISNPETMKTLKILTGFRQNSDSTGMFLVANALKQFRTTVGQLRGMVDARFLTCSKNIQLYTDFIMGYIDKMVTTYASTEEGQFWAIVDAFNTLMIMEDSYGITRALGSKYYSAGYLSKKERTKLIELLGSIDAMIRKSKAKSAVFSEQMDALIDDEKAIYEELQVRTTDMKNNVIIEPNPQAALDWFANMTIYMGKLQDVEHFVSRQVLSRLDKKMQNAEIYLGLTLTTVLLVLCCCLPLTYWYAMHLRNLMAKLKTFMTLKTQEIKIEKEKTDHLLYELLPKQIATAIKCKEKVEPELFDSVTVCYTDIVGFTSLSSKSTPFQICEVLNDLWSTLDKVIDNYDVYKVETIGDAYFVASGLPRRNGTLHAAEIGTMALDLVCSLKKFLIPHIGYEPLLVRVGCHTGPCAAGVVGVKMPRYCLFGETVTLAAKMESTSAANRIQISEDMKSLLENDFILEPKGTVQIDEETDMVTYWLLKRLGYEFKIDLREAEEIKERTTYWRLNYDASKTS